MHHTHINWNCYVSLWPIARETVLLSKTLLVPTVARLALLQTQMDNLQEEKKKEREDSCMLRQQNWVGWIQP